MKKIYSLLPILLFSIASFGQDQAMRTICIHDNYGYVWTFTNVKINSGVVSGTGTVLVLGQPWNATGKFNNLTGDVLFNAQNPNSDGCINYSDGFIYEGTGTGTISGGNILFTGSGDWTSYCAGAPIQSGAWSATDCSHKAPLNNREKQPAHSKNISLVLKVSPNPVASTARVIYKIPTAGNVNITLYNSMQQLVRMIVNDYKAAGTHTAILDVKTGKSLQPGIYSLVSQINQQVQKQSLQILY